MAIISVKGFYDLHLHTSPAPFVRIGDSADIARWCAAEGMAGIVIKSHFESTVSKVHHAKCALADEYPDFKIFAGIALNRGVGGVNPGAVAIALHQGARIVWLPTIDAEGHALAFGATGTYGVKCMSLDFKGSSLSHGNLTVLKNGRLTDETKEIVELVVGYDAVLATGHVSKEEVLAVAEYAASKKVQKLVVTHPEFTVPNLDIDTMVNLARMGIFMELCGINCFPMWDTTTIAQFKEMIEAVGVERVVLSSDTGQPYSPRPPETLRVFSQILHERGISEEAIQQMAVYNPAHLLGVK